MAEAGFQIGDEVYPFTGSLRLTDPVLIERVTGLHFTEFAKRQDAALKAATDPAAKPEEFDAIVMLGLVAVSVSQAHPDWSFAQVTDFISGVRFEDLTAIAGDANPPALVADPDSSGAPAILPSTPEPHLPEAA